MVILSYPLAFDAPVRGGFPSEYRHPFGLEKLEWCRYPMVTKFRNMFIRFDVIHERDGRTDGRTERRTDTASQQRPRLCIASRGNDVMSIFKMAYLSHLGL